jgi:AAA+ superfamily predicted ATPase
MTDTGSGSGDGQADPLLQALAADPANALLRMALVRRFVESGEKSRALALALDVASDAITEPGDRQLIAGLLSEAGLKDRAEAFGGAAAPPGKASAVPPSRPPDPDMDAAATGAAGPVPAKGPVNLRVVGGRESVDSEAALAEPDEKSITFADVGGLAQVKKDIERRIIAPFTQKDLYAKFRKRAGGGVLLYGPPGCGKTLLARATAGECGLPFQSISIPDVLDPLSGMSERRLSQLFKNARERAPAVLFFDEIDALASKRTNASATHAAQLVSHFLAEMDGSSGASNDGLFVLAATNVPWSLDSAFLRPGRFDRLFFVPPPDAEARAAIFDLELGHRPRAEGINLLALAKHTSGYSGADIASLVERAADLAIDASLAAGKETSITQYMLESAARSMRSSVTDWLSTARNYATYSNESGRYDDVLAFLQKHGA